MRELALQEARKVIASFHAWAAACRAHRDVRRCDGSCVEHSIEEAALKRLMSTVESALLAGVAPGELDRALAHEGVALADRQLLEHAYDEWLEFGPQVSIVHCTGCGCTDLNACVGGCWWVARLDGPAGTVAVCSNCRDHLPADHPARLSALSVVPA